MTQVGFQLITTRELKSMNRLLGSFEKQLHWCSFVRLHILALDIIRRASLTEIININVSFWANSTQIMLYQAAHLCMEKPEALPLLKVPWRSMEIETK